MKKFPINRDRIRQVIYPTLGYPVIVKRGEQFTLEFDPRNQGWSKALPQITDFKVSVTTTNSTYPITRSLSVKDFTLGFSTHWPEYSQDAQPRAHVYLVTVEVPKTAGLSHLVLPRKTEQQQQSQQRQMTMCLLSV